MPGRRLTATLVIIALDLICVQPARVHGMVGGSGEDKNAASTGGGVTSQGRVYATVSLRGGVVTVASGPAGSSPRGPVCSWAKSLFNTFDPNRAGLPVEIVETGTDGWYFDPATQQFVTAPGPGIETLYYVQGPGTA